MVRRTVVLSVVLSVLAAAPASADEKVDFQKQIQPILLQHCAGCHGEEKALGKMRLHTAAAVKEKWDADEHLLVAGDPEKSELYERLVLPADHKKRMPKNADPLPQETIDLIARWIREGAALPLAAAVEPAPPDTTEQPAEAPAAAEPAAELPLPEVAAAPSEAVNQLAGAGAQVMPLFAGSSLLQVSFAHRGEPAADADITHLAGVAEQVYALNLAGAQVSDAGLAALAGLKNLSVLHLEGSTVGDAGLAHLAELTRLQYLNLYGTGISDEGLQHLAGLKHLRRLYLWQTNVSYDAAMAMEKDIPGLVVNLGYNHPVVVRQRLTKEIELVKQQAEEAKAEQAKVEQQLEAAKKNAEALGARLSQIENELKELEAPAADQAEGSPAGEAEAANDAQAANE